MAKLPVGELLKRAEKLARKGDKPGARRLFGDVLAAYPNNKKARAGIQALGGNTQSIMRGDPPEGELRPIIEKSQAGQRDAARRAAQSLLQVYPASAVLWNMLGAFLQVEGRSAEAERALRKAIKHDRDLPEAHYNLGRLLRAELDVDGAERAYREALRANPRYAQAWSNLAKVLQDQSKPDEAVSAYQKALEIDPRLGSAYMGLAAAIGADLDHPLAIEMQRLLEFGEPDDKLRVELGFALAGAARVSRETAKEFEFVGTAGAIRKKNLKYRFSRDQKLFAAAKRQSFELNKLTFDFETSPITPVFVLGLPRSGTSLVEQILASHSQVTAGGELGYLGRWLIDSVQGEAPLGRSYLTAVRSNYLAEVTRLSKGNPYFTDKMPANFRWIAFIAKLFPEAKIIHMTRDLRAVAWSTFSRYFPSSGMAYSFDLMDTVDYIKLYQRFMADIRPLAFGRIYDLNYEKLTEDQEGETKRLLDHVGLDWDPAVLNFHKTQRLVRTASRDQVKKPIYKGSSLAWEAYAEHLDGAFDDL